MIAATEWIMSVSGACWRTSPFTRVSIVACVGSKSVSITGPSGQNVSKPFARDHCPSLRCRSRAVTSLPIV